MPSRFVVVLSLVFLIASTALAQSKTGQQVENLVDAPLASLWIAPGESAYLLSRFHQALGHIAPARAFAETAVKEDPKRAQFHLQLASVLAERIPSSRGLARWSLARRIHSEIESAAKREPNNPDCLFARMQYYELAPAMAGGNKEKAKQVAEQIARIDASKGYLAQAQLARDEHHTGGLEQLYVRAVKSDPTSLSALAALAGFYVELRK